MQKILRLGLSRPAGRSQRAHRIEEELLNNPPGTVPPEKLFADLLKRQARSAMADVAASSAAAIDAHLSRCRSLREVIGFAMRHGQTPDDESALSGLQLIHMKTLADHLAALDHTIQAHRPPCVLPTDAMERIERKVDLLAGMVAGLLGQVSDESEVAA